MPALLVALSLVPVLAGTVRLVEVAGGVVTLENARFLTVPLPGLLHLLTVTLFSLLGAFQFALAGSVDVAFLRLAADRWRLAVRDSVDGGVLDGLCPGAAIWR